MVGQNIEFFFLTNRIVSHKYIKLKTIKKMVEKCTGWGIFRYSLKKPFNINIFFFLTTSFLIHPIHLIHHNLFIYFFYILTFNIFMILNMILNFCVKKSSTLLIHPTFLIHPFKYIYKKYI